MSTPGSMATAAGFTLTLISVSAGMHFGDACDFGILLCFLGVLGGTSLVAVGVRMADGPAPMVPVTCARVLAAFVRRRSTAVVGLVMASCAVTMLVSVEAHPVLCFATFALLLLGVFLINIGARGE